MHLFWETNQKNVWTGLEERFVATLQKSTKPRAHTRTWKTIQVHTCHCSSQLAPPCTVASAQIRLDYTWQTAPTIAVLWGITYPTLACLLKAAEGRNDLARNSSVTWVHWPVSQLLILTWSPAIRTIKRKRGSSITNTTAWGCQSFLCEACHTLQ